MPNFPCPNPAVACPGVDSPVQNLSAEQPDVRKFFGYKFFDTLSLLCESEDAEVAAVCDPPFPTNPPIPVVYSSSAQTCTIICPDLSIVSYTAVPGSAIGLSQALADQAAHAFACAVAMILCSGPLPQIFLSSEQSCTFTCADGTIISYIVPAGTFAGLSQNSANALAASFACAIVALLCPLPPSDLGVFIDGAGDSPMPPFHPRYANGSQSCVGTCPDGSTFTFIARAGLFIRDTLAEANAVASSYACRQAELRKVCLSSIQQEACAGDFYAQLIVGSGLVEPVTWEVSGTIPTGMTFEEGELAGVPTTGGPYDFTVTAVGADGGSAVRSYTVDVIQILPNTLPDGTVNTVYSQGLSQAGGALPTTWGVTGGALPAGLSLGTDTGILGGTPTVSGLFLFTVGLATGSGVVCSKTYSLLIKPSCPDWATLSWTAVTGSDIPMPPATAVFVPNPGSSASFNGTASVPAFPPDLSANTGGIGTGELTYNGSGCNCQIVGNFGGAGADPSEFSGSLSVYEDAVLIVSLAFTGASTGAYVLPFSLVSTGGNPVTVQVVVDFQCNNLSGGPSNVALSGTVSNV